MEANAGRGQQKKIVQKFLETLGGLANPLDKSDNMLLDRRDNKAKSQKLQGKEGTLYNGQDVFRHTWTICI